MYNFWARKKLAQLLFPDEIPTYLLKNNWVFFITTYSQTNELMRLNQLIYVVFSHLNLLISMKKKLIKQARKSDKLFN